VIQVTVAEAQKRLPELLVLVKTGESVEIHHESGESFALVHRSRNGDAAIIDSSCVPVSAPIPIPEQQPPAAPRQSRPR
jgi:antitoxin (DNA-binding transcriptional repressor) of toxin-antitoxin stability system